MVCSLTLWLDPPLSKGTLDKEVKLKVATVVEGVVLGKFNLH